MTTSESKDRLKKIRERAKEKRESKEGWTWNLRNPKASEPKKLGLRTATCKLCLRPIEITAGMEEMEEHWREQHPDGLAALRRKLGHDAIEDRDALPLPMKNKFGDFE